MTRTSIPRCFGNIASLTAPYRERIKSHDLLVEPVFTACKLTYGRDELRLLDAMSGPGGLGLELLAKFDQQRPQNDRSKLAVVFNDLRYEAIHQIDEAFSPDSFTSFLSDIRYLRPTLGKEFDVAVVRYGLTELTKIGMQVALRSIGHCLLPGGRIVVADMAANSEKARKGIVAVRAATQEMAGMSQSLDDRCNIPLMEEWPGLLTAAGFNDARMAFSGASDMDSRQWAGRFLPGANDGQITKKITHLINSTCEIYPAFADEFHAIVNSESATLKIPVTVVSGNKQ